MKYDGDTTEFVGHIEKVSLVLTVDVGGLFKYWFLFHAGSLCFENRVLCSRIHAFTRSSHYLQMEPGLRENCTHVAGWVHHSECIPRQHQVRIPGKSETHQLAFGRFLQGGNERLSSLLAESGCQGSGTGHPNTVL